MDPATSPRTGRSLARRKPNVGIKAFIRFNHSVDYSIEAVLGFDNDFRTRVVFEVSKLVDSDCCRSVADRYFHAASRSFASLEEALKNRSVLGTPRTPVQYTTASQPSIPLLNGIPICKRWNAGSCLQPCRYNHCCEFCFDQRHLSSACPNRAIAQQQNSTQQH